MARKIEYDTAQLRELLLQALETERGGIQIYENAIKCAVNDDLKKEWQEYLEETRTHEKVLLNVFSESTPRSKARAARSSRIKAKPWSPPSRWHARTPTPTRPTWSPANAWCSPKPRTI